MAATKLKIIYGDDDKTIGWRQSVEVIERVIACYASGYKNAPSVSDLSGDDVNLVRFILDIVQRTDKPPVPVEIKEDIQCKNCRNDISVLPCVMCGIAGSEIDIAKVARQNPLIKNWRRQLKRVRNDKYISDDYRDGLIDSLEQSIEDLMGALGHG